MGVAETLTEHSAGTEGYKRLVGLVCIAADIRLRILKTQHSCRNVVESEHREHRKYHYRGYADKHENACNVSSLCAAYVEHADRDNENDERSGEVRLDNDKPAGNNYAYHYRQKAFFEAFHIVIVSLHIVGYDKDSDEFKYLGGLYRDRAYCYPAFRAVYGASHYTNEQHKPCRYYDRRLEHDFREQNMIVDEGDDYHSCQTAQRKQKLAVYEVVAVLVRRHLCGSVSRGEQHNKPECEQDKDDEEEGKVELLGY